MASIAGRLAVARAKARAESAAVYLSVTFESGQALGLGLVEEAGGVCVQRVDVRGQAQHGGVLRGDQLVGVNGRDVRHLSLEKCLSLVKAAAASGLSLDFRRATTAGRAAEPSPAAAPSFAAEPPSAAMLDILDVALSSNSDESNSDVEKGAQEAQQDSDGEAGSSCSGSSSRSSSSNSSSDEDDAEAAAAATATRQQLQQLQQRLASVAQQKRAHERSVAAEIVSVKNELAGAGASAGATAVPVGSTSANSSAHAPQAASPDEVAANAAPAALPASSPNGLSPSELSSSAWALSPVMSCSSAAVAEVAEVEAAVAKTTQSCGRSPSQQLLLLSDMDMQSSFLEMKSQLGQLAAQQSQLVQHLQHAALGASVSDAGQLSNAALPRNLVRSPGTNGSPVPSMRSIDEEELRRVEDELAAAKKRNATLESEMKIERQSVAAAHLVTKKLVQTENRLAQLRQEKLTSFLTMLGDAADPELSGSADDVDVYAPILACGASSVLGTLRGVFRQFFVTEAQAGVGAELGVLDTERLAVFASTFRLVDSRLSADAFQAIMVGDGDAGRAVSFTTFLSSVMRLAERKFPDLERQQGMQRLYDILAAPSLPSPTPGAPSPPIYAQHTPAPATINSGSALGPAMLGATNEQPKKSVNDSRTFETAWAQTHSKSSSDLALELSQREGANGEHDEWLLDLIEQETTHVGGLILATGDLNATDASGKMQEGSATAVSEAEPARSSPVPRMTLASALDDMPCIEFFSMLASRGLRALFNHYAKHERSSKPIASRKMRNSNNMDGYSKLDSPGDARVLDVDAFVRLLGAMRLCPQAVPSSGAAKVFSASVSGSKRTQRFGAFCEALARLSVLVVAHRSQQSWTVREMCVTMFYDLDRARNAEGRSILFYTPPPIYFGAEIEAMLFNLFGFYSPTNMNHFPDGGWGMSSSQLMKFSRDFGLVGEHITPPHVDLISQKCLHAVPLPGSNRMRRARFHTFASFCLTVLNLVEARWPVDEVRSPGHSINKLFARRVPGYE